MALKDKQTVLLHNWTFKAPFQRPLGETDTWLRAGAGRMCRAPLSLRDLFIFSPYAVGEDDGHWNPKQIIHNWQRWELLATAFWDEELKVTVIIWKNCLALEWDQLVRWKAEGWKKVTSQGSRRFRQGMALLIVGGKRKEGSGLETSEKLTGVRGWPLVPDNFSSCSWVDRWTACLSFFYLWVATRAHPCQWNWHTQK